MAKKIQITGLLLPKDKISRNGVLYDWDSIKAIYHKLVGLPLLYNHLYDGEIKPIGKFIKSWLKEKDDEDGIAGWYYMADINPNSEYVDSILRGDINKVSVQVIAKDTKPEKTDDGKTYTRAFVSDIIEGSAVPTPGFPETSMNVVVKEAIENGSVINVFSENFKVTPEKGYEESTRDIVFTINSKKKILPLSGSWNKAVDEEGNDWRRIGTKWGQEKIFLNIIEDIKDGEVIKMDKDDNEKDKEPKEEDDVYKILKEQEDGINEITDILEAIAGKLTELEDRIQAIEGKEQEPEAVAEQYDGEAEEKPIEPEVKKEQEPVITEKDLLQKLVELLDAINKKLDSDNIVEEEQVTEEDKEEEEEPVNVKEEVEEEKPAEEKEEESAEEPQEEDEEKKKKKLPLIQEAVKKEMPNSFKSEGFKAVVKNLMS